MRHYIRLFFTAFLQVFLVAVSTVTLSKGLHLATMIVSFGISYLWSGNIKRVAFGGELDKVIYATGAALGSGAGLFYNHFIFMNIAQMTFAQKLILTAALAEVRLERENQHAKWGEQNCRPPEFLAILTEEVGEVAKEVVEIMMNNGHEVRLDDVTQMERYRALHRELIQVAAVAVQFSESIYRNVLNK